MTDPPTTEPVDLDAVFSAFTETWSPRTVATVNDYDVRVARVHGEFTPHGHPETDEFFLVLSGELVIRMAAGDVTLAAGQAYVVPKGVRHQPVAAEETRILLIEPSETVNTGDSPSELTAERRTV